MFLAVRAMPVLEHEMHCAVDPIAHAIERADRRLRSHYDTRVENGDRRAEELELAGQCSMRIGGAR